MFRNSDSRKASLILRAGFFFTLLILSSCLRAVEFMHIEFIISHSSDEVIAFNINPKDESIKINFTTSIDGRTKYSIKQNIDAIKMAKLYQLALKAVKTPADSPSILGGESWGFRLVAPDGRKVVSAYSTPYLNTEERNLSSITEFAKHLFDYTGFESGDYVLR